MAASKDVNISKLRYLYHSPTTSQSSIPIIQVHKQNDWQKRCSASRDMLEMINAYSLFPKIRRR